MIQRQLNILKTRSFILLGARGTGKTTYLQEYFSGPNLNILRFDLLNQETEHELIRYPMNLEKIALAKHREHPLDWVVIDEIQKIPKLLNIVHRMIESHKIKFALSGSSARKLKRGAANLLAGRAFLYQLHPFTHQELADSFKLEDCLNWGSLPQIFSLKNDQEKEKYLKSYGLLYINEEIKAEQILRKLDPFRDFLEIAAQYSGKIIDLSKMAREVGVDHKTIKSYFQILEDTYLGFFLPSYHRSIRKAQRVSPKFYFFDCGVRRALERSFDVRANPRTSYFGDLFENFLVNEIRRHLDYKELDYRLTYLASRNSQSEIDLILDRGRRPPILIEIKSTDTIDPNEVRALSQFKKDFPKSPLYYLSQDPLAQDLHGVQCLPWKNFFKGPI